MGKGIRTMHSEDRRDLFTDVEEALELA